MSAPPDSSPLVHWATTTPDAIFLCSGRHQYRYASCLKAVQQYTAALDKLYLEPGALLGMTLSPSPRAIYLLLAALHQGLTVFPLNPKFPKDYLVEQLNKVGCQQCVTDQDLTGITCIPLPRFKKEPELAELDGALPSDQPATLVLTSGSSGAPKAAQHSIQNHRHNAQRSNGNIPLKKGASWLLSLPLHHVAGLGILFRCLEAGATIALPKENESLDAAITSNKVTHVSLVAKQLQDLLKTDALDKVKAILLGGGPAPDALLESSLSRGLPLYTTYGMTEMATQITTTRPDAVVLDLKSAGWPLEEDSVKVNEEGVICVGGPCLFQGYRNATGLHLPLDETGYLVTGDRGHWDEAGRLHITGRQDNMFISGGENVQPEAIETCLGQLPEIEAICVMAVPDAQWGQVPAAVVKADAFEPEAWSAALQEQLPKFCIPKHWIPWSDTLAENEGIKVRRGPIQEYARTWVEEKG